MSRIFITGSSDGLGLMAARLLMQQGHSVVLHARNINRAAETHHKVPEAQAIVTGDLSSLQQMRSVANQVNALGTFDAIIHNAAVGYREPQRIETEDGLAHVFAINSLAPYVLTALINPPHRLIYISSGLHKDGDPSLRDLNWKERSWQGQQAYSDSKLHNVLLAFATARRLPGVLSNTMTPGWVPTKMGGAGANDDLDQAQLTQAWLAASSDPASRVSGKFFYHLKAEAPLPASLDWDLQNRFIDSCEQLTGVRAAAMLLSTANIGPANRLTRGRRGQENQPFQRLIIQSQKPTARRRVGRRGLRGGAEQASQIAGCRESQISVSKSRRDFGSDSVPGQEHAESEWHEDRSSMTA